MKNIAVRIEENETCATCAHFNRDKDQKEIVGQCRAGPPQVVLVPAQNLLAPQQQGMMLQAVAPPVAGEFACGAWVESESGIVGNSIAAGLN